MVPGLNADRERHCQPRMTGVYTFVNLSTYILTKLYEAKKKVSLFEGNF